jgi:DNA repair protein RadB
MFPETHERRLKNLIIFKPTTFKEQTELFRNLEKFSEEHDPKLIVVDSLSMLYRLELGEREAYEVNKEMARQIGVLRKISHKLVIPILLTNQVYADFENKNDIKMVGGDLMKYTSKCIIKLELSEHGRLLKLLKHRSIPIKDVQFKITQKNIEKSTEKRKFSLF